MDISHDLSNLQLLASKFSEATIETRNRIIADIAEELEANSTGIISENARDLAAMNAGDPMYDRVSLDERRIQSMIQSCITLIGIADPLGNEYDEILHPTAPIQVVKRVVPLGVVACIYEARPNVTIDLAILCIKSGNICVLKGGTQATHTNAYLRSLIQQVFVKNGFVGNCCYGFSEQREDLPILLQAHESIDVIIPRGGKNLIDFVRKNSLVPVIETGAGVVHIFVDKTICKENYSRVVDVIINAKTSRPSVCNALDTILMHREAPKELTEAIILALQSYGVVIGMLEEEKKYTSQTAIESITADDFHAEYLALRCGIKFVDDVEEAIAHIARYSSHHSESILTDDIEVAQVFQRRVDSAVVYHNTSTRFSDGGCFGFGAEVGISTQKIHARGPMGCRALTTYKYVVDSLFSIRK